MLVVAQAVSEISASPRSRGRRLCERGMSTVQTKVDRVIR
jgi:hypothetical protein